MIPKYFTKMAGGGNDFLVFAEDGQRLRASDRETIARLCTRRLSIGADGALFVQPEEDGSIRVDYYNRDGGLALFCANGTRCAARFAVREGLVRADTAVLSTGWTKIRAEIGSELVTLRMPELPMPGEDVGIDGEALPQAATPLLVGVPHLVVFVEGDLARLPVAELGPPLRHHPAMPEGANVNFVKVEGKSRLAVRTFERGVEAETLSCGSGVVASAVVAALKLGVVAPVVCRTRSGIDLTVDFEVAEGRPQRVRLAGDARFIYEGEIKEDAVRFS